MNLPVVSIVTLSYNQAQFLEKAIQSVINQTYPHIEYIIFDGGSVDSSVPIIERYGAHFAHVSVGPDGGPPAALNAAFRLANGEIHAYLNADDLLHPRAAETWVNAFARFPTADIVYGDIEIINADGSPGHLPGRRVSRFMAAPFTLRSFAAGATVIPQQAAAWRNRVFVRVGGFNETNATCWDYEFFVDAALAGFEFKRISGFLGKFRVHPQSISGSNRNQRQRVVDHARIRSKWRSAGIIVTDTERLCLLRSMQAVRLLRYVAMRLRPAATQ